MDTTTSHASMVSSGDVNGTAVFSPAGERLGHIDEIMIDKVSGKIAYAVLGFGGFLGFGEGHHPLPWGKLRYDTDLGGYVTDVTPEQLEAAPEPTDGWAGDKSYLQDAYRHYGVAPYWM